VSANTVISAFSAEHVTQITGLTPRQLAYWDAVGFFRPTLSEAEENRRPIRVYSFTDVVGLRVLSVLRSEYKISLQHLRWVAEKLAALTPTPWASLKLAVCKDEVLFSEPDTGRLRGVISGQYVLVPIIEQIEHVKRAAAELSHRRPEQIGSTEKHRNVAHNKEVVAGTRVPVRAIERFLAAGYSVPAILAEYPSVQKEDIEAIAERGRRQAVA